MLRCRSLPSATIQFGGDSIAQAAFLDRVAKRRHIRQLLQDEAQFGAAVAPIEHRIEVVQKPRKAVALLDQVIELGVAARDRRRIAANLVRKQTPGRR